MALYDRILRIAGEKIPVHSFVSALGEWQRGKLTAAQVAAAFGLSSPEQTEALTLRDRIIIPEEIVSLGSWLPLAAVGATFDSATGSSGLGFCRVNLAGVDNIRLDCYYNKLGLGDVTWQLWDQTDGVALGSFVDTGVTGTKILGANFTIGSLSGYHILRPRLQSTIGTDALNYHGSSLILRGGIERLHSWEVHEILQMGESGHSYTTTTDIKARLGV